MEKESRYFNEMEAKEKVESHLTGADGIEGLQGDLLHKGQFFFSQRKYIFIVIYSVSYTAQKQSDYCKMQRSS